MKGKIKATAKFPPYGKDGLPTLKTNTGGGVYIIREIGIFGGTVLYVGKSHADLKKTLYRHFQKWTDKRTAEGKKWQIWERITYYGQDKNNFTVQVFYCSDIASIDLLETTLIHKYHPRDNKQKLEFYTIDQMDTTLNKLDKAEYWKPISEKNPF